MTNIRFGFYGKAKLALEKTNLETTSSWNTWTYKGKQCFGAICKEQDLAKEIKKGQKQQLLKLYKQTRDLKKSIALIKKWDLNLILKQRKKRNRKLKKKYAKTKTNYIKKHGSSRS